MSNRISLQFTKFVNLDNEGKELDESYGYRLYDDYASIYNNTFDDIASLKEEINEENFWEVLDQHSEFDDVDVFETGMYFNGDWYDGDEIEKMI